MERTRFFTFHTIMRRLFPSFVVVWNGTMYQDEYRGASSNRIPANGRVWFAREFGPSTELDYFRRMPGYRTWIHVHRRRWSSASELILTCHTLIAYAQPPRVFPLASASGSLLALSFSLFLFLPTSLLRATIPFSWTFLYRKSSLFHRFTCRFNQGTYNTLHFDRRIYDAMHLLEKYYENNMTCYI